MLSILTFRRRYSLRFLTVHYCIYNNIKTHFGISWEYHAAIKFMKNPYKELKAEAITSVFSKREMIYFYRLLRIKKENPTA